MLIIHLAPCAQCTIIGACQAPQSRGTWRKKKSRKFIFRLALLFYKMIRKSDIAARKIWSRNTRYTPLKLRSNRTCSLAQEAVQIDMNGAGGGDRPATWYEEQVPAWASYQSCLPITMRRKILQWGTYLSSVACEFSFPRGLDAYLLQTNSPLPFVQHFTLVPNSWGRNQP